MTDPGQDRCVCGHLRASHRPAGPHYPAVCIARVEPGSDKLGFCLCEHFHAPDALPPAPPAAIPTPPLPTSRWRRLLRRRTR